MSDANPYASPITDSGNPFASPQSGSGGYLAGPPGDGLWRKGKLLVMDKFAPLPDRCVKSNQPAGGRTLKRNLSWHHPWVFILLLISIWVYVIVALIIRKQATIHIGLSEAWFGKRRKAMLVGWTLALLGIAAVIASFPMMERVSAAPLLLIGGIVAFLGAAIYGLVAARMVVAARINERYVWLKGVHPDFLATLPDWPNNP